MSKPKGMEDEVWEQHKEWIKVMQEGDLTTAPTIRDPRMSSQR
jgi:hypothetical protein